MIWIVSYNRIPLIGIFTIKPCIMTIPVHFVPLWIMDDFETQHPIIYWLIALFILRYCVQWFFGITHIRRAQRDYADLLQDHNSLLEKQNRMLEWHNDVLGKLDKQ